MGYCLTALAFLWIVCICLFCLIRSQEQDIKAIKKALEKEKML